MEFQIVFTHLFNRTDNWNRVITLSIRILEKAIAIQLIEFAWFKNNCSVITKGVAKNFEGEKCCRIERCPSALL